VVVHTCNSSCVGSTGRGIVVQADSGQKCENLPKKITEAKRAEGNAPSDRAAA
jgi:hypothetical protein